MLPLALTILRRARRGYGKAGARLPHSYQTNISITTAAAGNSPQDVQVIVDIVPAPGLLSTYFVMCNRLFLTEPQG